MNEIVLMSDPRVAAIPVEECDEPLLDCRSVLRVDQRRSDTAGDWAHLRAGVLRRLIRLRNSASQVALAAGGGLPALSLAGGHLQRLCGYAAAASPRGTPTALRCIASDAAG